MNLGISAEPRQAAEASTLTPENMNTFAKSKTISLPPAVIAKAAAFAEKVVKTVNYRDSNQDNHQKIRDDHFISKLGEEAVRSIFEALGARVEGPDYEIYEGKSKSWAHDLSIDDEAVAVKTQKTSAARKYGLSWTFQQSGFRNDPVLGNPEAWICFVECDDRAQFRCTVFPPRQVKNLIFREPKLPHLQGKKKVVYAADF